MRVEIVDDGEVLVQRRGEQHGQVQPRVLDGERGFRERLLLLQQLNLRLDDIGVGRLAEAFPLLRDVEESLRLRGRLLRARIATFGRDERVRRASPSRRARAAQSPPSLWRRLRRPVRGGMSWIPACWPRALDAAPSRSDRRERRRCRRSGRWRLPVSLRAEVLRGVAERREARRACLRPIARRHLRVRQSRLRLCVVLPRSLDGIPQRDDRGRRAGAAGLDQLQRGSRRRVLCRCRRPRRRQERRRHHGDRCTRHLPTARILKEFGMNVARPLPPVAGAVSATDR